MKDFMGGEEVFLFSFPLPMQKKETFMASMQIIKVLKQPRFALLAIVSGIAMFSLYLYTQVLGNVHNMDVWFATIPWYNAILTIVFTVLFGTTFSYQIFLWRQPKTCSVQQKVAGAGTTGIGSIGLFLIAQCPACASLGTLFLPLSAMAFLTQYSWMINLLTIGALLFTLNYLGAFKKDG